MATYYNLVIRCPACIAEGDFSGYPSQWYHTGCGGKLRIGDNARLRCYECGHEEHIMHWRWSCQSHEGNYKYTTSNAFTTAISIATQMVDTAGKRWLLTILDNLGDF